MVWIICRYYVNEQNIGITKKKFIHNFILEKDCPHSEIHDNRPENENEMKSTWNLIIHTNTQFNSSTPPRKCAESFFFVYTWYSLSTKNLWEMYIYLLEKQGTNIYICFQQEYPSIECHQPRDMWITEAFIHKWIFLTWWTFTYEASLNKIDDTTY